MPVDMSPAAVSRRLRKVDELRELCLALAGPRLKRPWGVPAPDRLPFVDPQRNQSAALVEGSQLLRDDGLFEHQAGRLQ